MTHQIFSLPKEVLFSGGVIQPGWKVSFFLTGTTTPTPVYTTSALSVTHTQPVQADSAGVMPAIYLDPSIAYKASVYNSADVLQYTVDPVNESVISAATVGAALWRRTDAEIAAGVTPTNYAYPPGDVRRYGAVGDNSTNCTTAFANAELANDEIFIPAGIWKTDTLVTTRTGIKIRTEGFSTLIQQNSGTSNTLPLVQIKHSDCIVESFAAKGNISTDTLEFKHALMVYNSAGSIQNVTVGDLYAEDIRGDALYIGAPSGQTTRHVKFGRIVGKNILRNVVSIVGASHVVGVAAVVDTSAGYAALDIEPDGLACSDILVAYVRGGVLQCAPPTLATTAKRIHIGMADLDPAFQADSTPSYTGYAAEIVNAVWLRNTVGMTIDYLKIRDHTGLGIKYIWNGGEQKGEAIEIGYLDSSGVGASESTYNALIEGANIRSLRIRDGVVALQAVGDTLFLGDSSAKDNEVQIDRLQIDGTLIRYGRNCKFSNIRVNSTNAATLIREVDDSVLEASDITFPNLLVTCVNTTLIGVKATCSGTYLGSGVTGTTMFGCSGGLASILAGSATYDPANLADGAGVTTTVTATGAAVGDFAEASFSNALQGIILTAWVSASDTVSVRFQNESTGAIDLASGTLRVRVRKA
jgi:hypothetical protein